MKKHLLISTLIVMLFLAIMPISAQDNEIVYMTVDASEEVGTVSPYVYGANFGPLQTVPATMFEEAAASGIRLLRFPGGRWGDTHDIRGNDLDFLRFAADMIGADITINVRVEGGTPEAAAELVRDVNIERGWNIRVWGIGNEPDLFADYDTERFNTEWRAIAEAMLAVDPDILLVGPELSQWQLNAQARPRDAQGRLWLEEFLQANGDLVDIVSVHRYPFPPPNEVAATVEQLRDSSLEFTTLLDELRSVVQETTGRDLPVAITEINSHWNNATQGEATSDSHYAGVWWADVLGKLIYQQPYDVVYHDFQSAANRGGMGLMGRSDLRPSYFVYQFYQQFGDTLLARESSDEFVNIYAARREDGAITLILTNLADDARDISLELNGFEGDVTATWVMDEAEGYHQAENVALDDLFTLAGRSVMMLVIE